MSDFAHPATICQHEGEARKLLGAVVPPIFQNTLFVHEAWENFESAVGFPVGGPYHYSRVSNPTLEVAERKIAALEGTEDARLFSSGMAAISAGIMGNVRAGSHVVCVDSIYGPTRMFLTEYLAKFGVTTTYVVGENPEDFVRASVPETSLWVLESPTSIVFRLQDLAEVSKRARSRGIATLIDNSYSSPIFQQPHRLGIDLVAHTVSKYLGGHSDVVGGVLCGSNERMAPIRKFEYELLGSAMSPFNAWLVNRSMRTLGLRMRAVQESARRVAEWLASRPEVERVFYVGSPGYPQAELRDRQMGGWGGLVTFEPSTNTREWCKSFTESLRLFQLGVSWGGHESLVVPLEYQAMDWPSPRWLIRLYCGLEAGEDHTADLAQGFDAAVSLR
ncbi:MAG: PLP-dependent transferase [Fimbriimonadaceae bacterium]|nr:PLP-dependent transferase [Fimbriimonadaceae bacterium]